MDPHKKKHQHQNSIQSQKSIDFQPTSKKAQTKVSQRDYQNSIKNQNQSVQNYEVASEEDYYFMLNIFKQIDHPSCFKRQTTILMSCLQQFTSKQLLTGSQLWNLPGDQQQIRHYLHSMSILQNEHQKYIVEKKNKKYIIQKQKQNLQIYEGHDIAIKVFNFRKQFLEKLNQKIQIGNSKILTDINQEMLFLYKQFIEQKKLICSLLNNIQHKKISMSSETSETYLLELKALQEKLYQLKRNKSKKKKQSDLQNGQQPNQNQNIV